MLHDEFNRRLRYAASVDAAILTPVDDFCIGCSRTLTPQNPEIVGLKILIGTRIYSAVCVFLCNDCERELDSDTLMRAIIRTLNEGQIYNERSSVNDPCSYLRSC